MAGTNSAFASAGVTVLSAGTTSIAAALTGRGDTALLTNPTASLAWFTLGTGTPVALAGAGIPVLPGMQRVVGIGLSSAVAAVLSAGSGTVYAEVGTGAAR